MISTAIFGAPGDESSRYRYVLTRQWGEGRTLAVIGVNPSTATATEDDPTIRRCIRFAADSGHGRLVMLNLFAWRATDVRELKRAATPYGEALGAVNDNHLVRECGAADTVVCAWGAAKKLPRALRYRWVYVVRMLRGYDVPLSVLRLTDAGDPAHPLYLPASCRPIPWSVP